jgi:redox-sensitive bicupin YhaK (pirin superfamily)
MIIKIPSRQIYQGDYGWHSGRFHFSFGDYDDPGNTQFGALLAFNDFILNPGSGFDTHPHSEIEIISYCVKGELIHADSMGNKNAIKRGQMQYTCAGSGITHSEINPSQSTSLRFVQIWIHPDAAKLTPRYFVNHYPEEDRRNKLLQITSGQAIPGMAEINRDANIYVSEMDVGKKLWLGLQPARKVYLACLEGSLRINGTSLQEGDAAKISDELSLNFMALADCHIILIDIPGMERRDC